MLLHKVVSRHHHDRSAHGVKVRLHQIIWLLLHTIRCLEYDVPGIRGRMGGRRSYYHREVGKMIFLWIKFSRIPQKVMTSFKTRRYVRKQVLLFRMQFCENQSTNSISSRGLKKPTLPKIQTLQKLRKHTNFAPSGRTILSVRSCTSWSSMTWSTSLMLSRN